MIRRSARRSGFTTLDNCIFAPGLSFRAIGLLAYLLSKPDNWSVSVAQLVNFSAQSSRPDGRDSVYGILDELLAAGYLRRSRTRSEGGRLGGFDYDVFDVPQPVESAESKAPDSPCPDLPYTAEPTPPCPDLPYTAEPTLTNTEKKQRLKGTREPAAPAPAVGLPAWLPASEWEAFRQHRRSLKAPMTAEAETRMIATLQRIQDAGHDPLACLNESIVMGWKGVFPPKKGAAPAPVSSSSYMQGAI